MESMSGKETAMLRIAPFPFRLLILAGISALMSSCAVVTKSTEASSETFENTSDASTDMTLSTSPRDEDRDSGNRKVKAYAAVNLDRLREDMARGGGEHLTAFAHLLGIRDTHRAEFYALARDRYPVLFSSEPTTSEVMLARLDVELGNHPDWRN